MVALKACTVTWPHITLRAKIPRLSPDLVFRTDYAAAAGIILEGVSGTYLGKWSSVNLVGSSHDGGLIQIDT